MTSQRVSRAGARAATRHVPVLTVALAALCVCAASPACAATAPQPPKAAASCVDTVFDAMTDRQRVGQLFAGGLSAAQPDPRQVLLLTGNQVGTVFLAGRSAAGTQATARVVAGLEKAAAGQPAGLLMATDQEGGQVQVLSGPGFTAMPSALVQGGWQAGTLTAAAKTWAQELKAAGVDLNFAPVADVVPAGLGKANAPIGAFDREFGSTSGVVATHSTAFLAGFQQAGVLATLKHFPGLGAVTGNTDVTAGVVDSVTTQQSTSLAPFAEGIKAGAPFVMVSLATYAGIDPQHRAVFSAQVMRQLLRTQLGFKGVVVSDDLGNAKQVQDLAPGDRAVAFLAAGGDMVLTVNANAVPAMTRAVRQQMAADQGFRSTVGESVKRILNAKQQVGLLTCQ
ncbi:glycoside hydrolase family 3 N-terminal domain-containing protein [Streptomyces sp. NPDC089919]|uniref:glycoside hydrolase family 3 N-terminal domain-containing protein n=1 Tax=Streptomyces sp. NPDC089919 TaxID=3155188 RepID=UPI003431FBE9